MFTPLYDIFGRMAWYFSSTLIHLVRYLLELLQPANKAISASTIVPCSWNAQGQYWPAALNPN